MRNRKYIKFFLLFLCTLICGVVSLKTEKALADIDVFNVEYTLQDISGGLLGETEMSESGYLYNLDGSQDYIYARFGEKGYAIFYKDTVELLEYSGEGEFPYLENNIPKYYTGPGGYYQGEGNQLYNTITGDLLEIDNKEIVLFSQETREKFSNKETGIQLKKGLDKNENARLFESTPNIDDNNLIPAQEDAIYIENKDFFINNVSFGDNNHGTCGSVAVQLLLNYHNYYSDRRIIEPYYLNGGWIHDEQVNGFDIFDRNNYSIPNDNPNTCVNPANPNAAAKGSNNDFYNYIISLVEPEAFECVDTTVTILGQEITAHSHKGSTQDDRERALAIILVQRLGIGNASIISGDSTTSMIAQIIQNNPMIIAMDSDKGGINHAVVGYGVQNYQYTEGGESYTGFIVNFGWKGTQNATNAWINSAWCKNFTAVNINHTHTYQAIGGIIENLSQEYRCTECGCRILDLIPMETTDLSDTEIQLDGIGEHIPLGEITIPSTINGKTVVSIGEGAFANQAGITKVYLPETVV